MWKYLLIVIAVLLAVIGFGWHEISTANQRWEAAEANVKSYDLQLSRARSNNMALQLTVDQLKYFNDSVLEDLNNTRQELKIKDKNLKALQQVSSSFSKKDTIYLDSIVFKEPAFALDTTLGDQWYSLRLGLQYPSMVAVKPEFKSEKHIVVSTKKETVNPPKKFFLFRWLQKKHLVLNIDVHEKNPYVDGEESKYIEIIK